MHLARALVGQIERTDPHQGRRGFARGFDPTRAPEFGTKTASIVAKSIPGPVAYVH